MINLLAAEGGYQAFHLGGADKTWLYICLVAGIVGIASGLCSWPAMSWPPTRARSR